MNYRVFPIDKPDEYDIIDAPSPGYAAEDFVYSLNADHADECGTHRVVVRWPDQRTERVYDVTCKVEHAHRSVFVEQREVEP